MLTSAIKAVDGQELTLDIVGLPFGADRQDQIFTPQTNIDLSEGDSVPVYFYHGFNERAAKAVSRVGRAVYKGVGTLVGLDGQAVTGQLFRVTLNSAIALAHRLYADAVKGLVRASSDSMAHLVRPMGILGKPGVVTSWPISGMSLMDASTYESAVNPRAIARAATIAATKAYLEDYEDELTDLSGEAVKAGATFARRNRERLIRFYAAMQEALPLLDEMMAEFPSDNSPTPEDPTPAAKSVLEMPREELIAHIDARIQEVINGKV